MEVTRYTVDANCYPRFKSETKRLLDISQRLNNVCTDTFGKSYPTNVHDSKIETDLHNENVELFLCEENTAKELSSITGNDMVLQNHGVSNRGSYIYDGMKTFLAGNKHLCKSTTVMVVPNNKSVNDIIKNVHCKTIIVSDSSKQNLRKLEKTYEEYTHVKVSTEDKVAADICSMLERTAFEPMKDKFKSVKCLLQGISPFTRGSKSCTDMTHEIPVYNKVTLGDENMDDKATYVRHTRSKTEETLRPEVKRNLYEGTSALANGDSLQRNITEKGIKRKSDDTEKRTTIITNGTSAFANKPHRNEREVGTRKRSDCYDPLDFPEICRYKKETATIGLEGENMENQASHVRQTRRQRCFSPTVATLQQEDKGKLYGGSVENQTTYLSQTRSGKLFSIPEGEHIENQAKHERKKRRTIIQSATGEGSLAKGEYIENQLEYVRKIRSGTIIQNATGAGSQAEGGNVENQITYLRQTRSGKFLSTLDENIQPEGEYKENQAKHIRKIRRGTNIQSATGEGSRVEGGNVENQTIYLRQTRSGKFLSTPEESFRPEGDSCDFKSKFIQSKSAFQRLFGEMIGMYKRSNLPEDLKPPLDVIPKEEVSQKMLSDLYKISDSIKGYAYRFCTRLQILVLEVDIEKLKPKIAEILESYGITEGSYDIVPPIDAVTPYSKLQAGAKVKLNESTYSSLTGFAKMQKGQQSVNTCAIASKHLLDGIETVELANEKVKITADVVPETAPGDRLMDFDIAIAKVRKDDEKHCEKQFKSESGTFMKGMVCSDENDKLDCQYVYIYGASTAKGLGIISMTHVEERKDNERSNPNKEHNDNDLSIQNKDRKQNDQSNKNKGLKDNDNGESNQNEKFIVVENREQGVPFCKKGDSGSMVCADHEDGNHVKLISTVNGEWIADSYQTLRITKGLTHLEEKTQSKISFFE